MNTPTKITISDVMYNLTRCVVLDTTPTADRTQQKTLAYWHEVEGATVRVVFRVTRCYNHEMTDTEVYRGQDLVEALRLYNGLS